MIALLAAGLVAGLPQGDVITLCNTVHYRQEYLHEQGTWEKAWIYLSFGGVELSPRYRREVQAFCAKRSWDDNSMIVVVPARPSYLDDPTYDPDEFFCDDTPHLDPQRCGLEPRR